MAILVPFPTGIPQSLIYRISKDSPPNELGVIPAKKG